MSRIQDLKVKIDALYTSRNPNRADWADWMYTNHVFVVADKAGELAERFNANSELAQASGMLHDIADSVMSRFNPEHEEKSLEMARQLLQETDYTEEEIALVVDDAIRFHSCHNGEAPSTLEGKVMATADAVVHLTTDFYDHALIEQTKEGRTKEEIKKWLFPKIERDYHHKIFFEEVKGEVAADYEHCKELLA